MSLTSGILYSIYLLDGQIDTQKKKLDELEKEIYISISIGKILVIYALYLKMNDKKQQIALLFL